MRHSLPWAIAILLSLTARVDSAIRPGEVWLDDRGQLIQAHGGGMLRFGPTFYWFGEDRTPTNDRQKRFVSCYASEDLVHWRFRHSVLQLADPAGLGEGWVLERPKVFYNAHTRKFLLYAHLDDRQYKLARVLVAVSDTVDGDYQFVKSLRPLEQESRDIGQFVDDGTAYLIFESRPTKGFFIARLSDDFLQVDKPMSLVKAPHEGGTPVHYGDLLCARFSPDRVASQSQRLCHCSESKWPWSEFHDMAPPETNTYGSQSTMLLKVQGTQTTTVIYMGDVCKPQVLSDSRYFWMPVTIGEGRLILPSPSPWTIHVQTRQSQILH